MTKPDPFAPFIAAARSAVRVRSAVQVLRALNGVSAIEFEDVDGTANQLALEAAYQKLSLRDFLGLLDGEKPLRPSCSLEALPSAAKIGARLRAVREALNLDESTFADFMAMDPTNLGAVEAGRALPPTASLRRLLHHGFDVNWVLVGYGQMRLGALEE